METDRRASIGYYFKHFTGRPQAGGNTNGLERAVLLLLAAWITAFWAPPCRAESSLFIITSFPEKLYTRTKEAFEAQNPDIKVKILNKKTSAAILYVQQTAVQPPDVFWASAPDAFEVLKQDGYLQHYRPEAPGIPTEIRGYPIHDPEGFYTGFAISGYGIMWNKNYMNKYRLPTPKSWEELTAPIYYRHIGMSAPSRSGTTHMAVESILQSQGWEAGWRTLLEIGGNLATVTARSFGVPDGVNNSRFGMGIVIDFFGTSAKASGQPVEYIYPHGTALTPANAALIRGARNPEPAKRFIDFLVSADGQRLLFEPNFRRLPVMPAIYSEAPKGYANPFLSEAIEPINFDRQLSTQRYYLVNVLFDQLITYRQKALSKLWQSLHKADAKAVGMKNKAALSLLARARELVTTVPVSEELSRDAEFTSIFKHKRRGDPIPTQMAAIEREWETLSRTNMKKAHELIIQAMSHMR